MGFDFKANNPADTAEVGYEFEVLLPSGEKTGAFIKVRGEMAPTVRNHQRRKYQEIQLKVKQAKRKGQELEDDLSAAEDLAVEVAVERIIDWRGFTEGKAEVAFSKEVAAQYMREFHWMREQVMEVSSNIFNFSKS